MDCFSIKRVIFLSTATAILSIGIYAVANTSVSDGGLYADPMPDTAPVVTFPQHPTKPPTETVTRPVVVFEEEPAPTSNGWTALDTIPLDPDLQQYVYDAAVRHGMQMSFILGIIERESNFDPHVDYARCYGLMQIHQINFGWLYDEGIDALTYPGNIDAGVLMISRLLDKYEDPHLALMAYNCGESGARRLWNQGTYTTTYSRGVILLADKWKEVLN